MLGGLRGARGAPCAGVGRKDGWMLPWLLSSASACVFLAEGQAGMAAGWWPCHSPTGMGSILRKAIPSPGTVRGSPGGQQGRAALLVGCIPLGTAVPQFPHIPIPFSLSQIPSRAAVPGRASPRTRRTPSPTRWVRGDAVGTPRGVPAPCCEASGDTVGTHHPALWGTRPIASAADAGFWVRHGHVWKGWGDGALPLCGRTGGDVGAEGIVGPPLMLSPPTRRLHRLPGKLRHLGGVQCHRAHPGVPK